MACDLTGNWFIVEARYRDALLVDWSWPELGTSVPGSECRLLGLLLLAVGEGQADRPLPCLSSSCLPWGRLTLVCIVDL